MNLAEVCVHSWKEHESHVCFFCVETSVMQKDANPDLNLPTASRPMGEMAAVSFLFAKVKDLIILNDWSTNLFIESSLILMA